MTPEEMDELYPTMRPSMSSIVSDATAWLETTWAPNELIDGRVLVLPLDSARCTIIVEHFIAIGWSVVGHVGDAGIRLIFRR